MMKIAGFVLAASTAMSAAAAAGGALPLRTVAEVSLTGDSSRLDYESLDPRTNLLFIAHLGAGEVIVFDARANRVVKTIAGVDGVHGVLAVPQLARVYASATGSNEIAVIDERSLAVIRRIPAGTYPDGMAFDARDQKLYVSDERGGTETVIDTRTDHRVATIPLGGEAGNTQYDAHAHLVYVNVQTKGELAAVDPSTDRIVARYPVPGCESNHGLLIDGDRRLAYIACENNARLVVFNLAEHRSSQAIRVGADPDVLAFDRGRSTLYVATESGTVSMFRARRDRLERIAEAFLAENAHVVAVDQNTHRVYFPLRNSDSRPTLRVMAPTR
jgi:YVTN family beta-propeller protein